MGAVDFSIDTRLVEHLTRVLPMSTFVETGTFEGEAVARVQQLFDEIHSIELSDKYYADAVALFDGDDVNLHHGDSSSVLGSLRQDLREKSVLYWLDAHWCLAEGTAGEHSECPLLDELQAIGSLNSVSVILIDDARLFVATPPVPHEVSDWPRYQMVLKELQSLSPLHEIMVLNDVIVFYPVSIVDTITDYARSFGIDWLAQLHRLKILEQEQATAATALRERLTAIEELTAVAEERNVVIAELERERDLQAQAAAERLTLLEKFARTET